jgi:antitoxin component YwqK of YwqJK toxin-antitoxin module
MYKLLPAMFVALLMTANGSPDLDDKETRDKIIAEAIDDNKLEWRGKKALVLHYAQNQPKPYTGWAKWMHENGRIRMLFQFKDGKIVGTIDYYYLKGQKRSECAWKNGKLVTAVSWKPNGDKCPVTNLKDEDLAMNLRTRISRADGYRQLEMFAD